MAAISVTGLISGSFDWQSVVSQLISIDSAPITTLQNEQATNNDKITSLAALNSDLTSLQTAADALSADGLFTGRSATSSTTSSTWTLAAANGATAGTYKIAVTQLATQAQRVGAGNIGAPLATTSDVSGLTLASLRTATAVTAGTFTVNDAQVTIDTTDSLAEVFQKISDATSGAVTAAYDPDTDTVSLSGSSGEVLLGSATDTSNFLSALQLGNNGTATATSSNALGTVTTTATLASAGLATTPAGSGTFTINGVGIAYDASTDTLAALLTRINESSAGVAAAYDATNDRLTLTNNDTGDTGMSIVDSTGGLLASLGLTTASGATYTRGLDAQFTVNGGAQRTSKSNALDATALGVTGLSVTVDSTDTQSIAVKPDTDAMKTAIQSFISAFNTVQTDIETATKITTSADNTVSSAVLSSNREVQDWSTKLRSLAFASVSGLSGSISRLENLGIDFSSTDTTLSIKDETKLDSALADNTEDVAAFFTQSSTGFVARMDTYLDKLLDTREGAIAMQTETLNKQNTSMDDQIATLKRRLEDESTRLTNSFLTMQTAQSTASTQLQTLTDMFSSSSSSS
jgi:flagellar hook-associated protein 2